MFSVAPGATGKLQLSMCYLCSNRHRYQSPASSVDVACCKVQQTFHRTFLECLAVHTTPSLAKSTGLCGLAAGATAVSAGPATRIVTASPLPSSIQRSHSASSEIVEAALQQHDALLNSSKREHQTCKPIAAAWRNLYIYICPCHHDTLLSLQARLRDNKSIRAELHCTKYFHMGDQRGLPCLACRQQHRS